MISNKMQKLMIEMLDKNTNFSNQSVYKSIKFYQVVSKLMKLGWVLKFKNGRNVYYRLTFSGVLIANAFRKYEEMIN